MRTIELIRKQFVTNKEHIHANIIKTNQQHKHILKTTIILLDKSPAIHCRQNPKITTPGHKI